MPQPDIPEGQLFTHMYCDRDEPQQDSETFRRRLGSYCQYEFVRYQWALGSFLKKETGLVIPQAGGHFNFTDTFLIFELKLTLNLITIIFRFFLSTDSPNDIKYGYKWLSFVERAMKEENMGYKVDNMCGVHYLIDQEFEHNKISALSCLQNVKYAGVLDAFETSFQYLSPATLDTKAAVRSMFECIEILAKMMTATPRLTSKVVKINLKTIAIDHYQSDKTMKSVVSKVFDGFAEWVDSIHFYRHGQPEEEPVAPPLDFTIFSISTGASFLRWLVELDKKKGIPE